MMKQEYVENNIYEILTSHGWEDFDGVTKNSGQDKDGKKIIFANGDFIKATDDHKFFINGKQILASEIKVGNLLDDSNNQPKIEVIDVCEIRLNETYDIFNTDSNSYISNGNVKTSNCDELSFVNNFIQNEFWSAINPTLSTGGSAIITSTPNGDQGLFAELWRSAIAGIGKFVHLYVPWDAPPGRDEEFKHNMIAEIGETKWKQEFECEFISSEALLISSMHMNEITDAIKKIKPLREVHDFVFWKQIKAGQTYIIGIDPSGGGGNDFSVMNIFTFPELEQVAQYRKNTMNTNEVYNILKNILLYIQGRGANVYFSVENNGVGEGIIALYEQDEKSPSEASFVSDLDGKNRRGFTTTSKSKLKSCITFKQLFESNAIKINSDILLSELKSYVRNKGTYAAQHGATDDCISSILIIMQIILQMAKYDDGAYDLIYNSDFGRITNEEWEEGDRTENYNEDNDEDLGIMII